MQIRCSELSNKVNTLLSIHNIFYCKDKGNYLFTFVIIWVFQVLVFSCKKPTLFHLAQVLVDRDVNLSQLDCQMN